MKKTAKVVVMSVLAIAMCISLIAGATFALFTSESSVNIAVTSGKVDVVATINEELTAYSYETIGVGEYTVKQGNPVDFVNGGSATIDDDTLTISNMTPGDKVEFTIDITNNSNVAIQYRTKISYNESEKAFYKALNVAINGANSQWTRLAVDDVVDSVIVSIELPAEAGNDYQDRTLALHFSVEAVQGNAQVENATVGMDSSDDATANGTVLADAMANAQEGDVIYVSGAEYALPANYEINTDGVELVGITDAYGNNPVITTDNSFVVTGNNVTIKNFDIESADNYALTVAGEGFAMDGCQVSRTTGAAPAYGMVVSVSATGDTKITNSVFVAPVAGSTSEISNASPSTIDVEHGNLIMSDCVIATNGYGLFAQHVKNATLTNVTFCGLDGYYYGSDVTVKSLYMAINSTCMKNVVLDGCTIKDTRSYGILAGGDNLTINNTTFTNIVNSTHIYFGWASKAMDSVTLTNNTFDLSTGYGPRFSTYEHASLDENTKVTIDNNTFINLAMNSDHVNRLIMSDCGFDIEATNCTIVNCPAEYQNNTNVIVTVK